MRAIALESIGDLEVIEKEMPLADTGEVIVKIKACGICGSDLPRVFINGAYHFPTVLGHEFSGQVVSLGEDVSASWLNARVAVFPLLPCHECKYCLSGDWVQCDTYKYFGSRNDGGFEEYLAVPVFNLLRLTDNISYAEGAMIEPATVAQHVVQRSQVKLGDNVVVYGAGPIGIMVAKWAELAGANKVVLFDIDQDKIDFVKSIGFEHVLMNEGDANIPKLEEIFGGDLADVVVEATGNTHSFDACVQSIKKFGHVTLLGNPHSNMTLQQKSYDQLMRREGNLYTAYNSVYKHYPVDEWQITEHALASGKLEIKDLITQEVPLDGVVDLFQQIHDHTIMSCKSMMIIN